MLSVGVIGYGYWGPNLVRNFQESDVSNVTMVSDLNDARLKLVKSRYPTVETTIEHRELLNSDSETYGGSGQGNLGGVDAIPIRFHGQEYSVLLTLPPLSVTLFKQQPPRQVRRPRPKRRRGK